MFKWSRQASKTPHSSIPFCKSWHIPVWWEKQCLHQHYILLGLEIAPESTAWFGQESRPCRRSNAAAFSFSFSSDNFHELNIKLIPCLSWTARNTMDKLYIIPSAERAMVSLDRWEIFYWELLIIDIWGFTITPHLARRHFENCCSWNLSTWKTKLNSTTCWRNFKLLDMSTKPNLL